MARLKHQKVHLVVVLTEADRGEEYKIASYPKKSPHFICFWLLLA